jgi:hypothetical protein
MNETRDKAMVVAGNAATTGTAPFPSACNQCPGCQAFVQQGLNFCPHYGQPLTPPSPAPTAANNVKSTAPAIDAPVPASGTAPPEPTPSSPAPPATPSPVITCRGCGQPAGKEDFFCSHCGNKVKDPPTQKGYWLVCRRPQSPPQSIPLPEGEFIVGKATDCTQTLSDDEYMSRRHLKLTHKDGKVILEDLGSSNGTFLRVRRSIVLEPDDEILVGSSILKMELRTS